MKQYVDPAPQAATAHRGFLARANAIDVAGLYALARRRGKRLVLCGHSLGGAVAKLCTLKLLRQLPSLEVANGGLEGDNGGALGGGSSYGFGADGAGPWPALAGAGGSGAALRRLLAGAFGAAGGGTGSGGFGSLLGGGGGGGVAVDGLPSDIKCVTFATPAVGNEALAELVEVEGWDG